VLEHNGLEFSCRERDGEFIMGRAADCDLVVNEPCVSREHAIIWVRHGRALLIDRISTGTFIIANGERSMMVRRESMPLVGSGTLSFGRSPDGRSPDLVYFQASTD